MFSRFTHAAVFKSNLCLLIAASCSVQTSVCAGVQCAADGVWLTFRKNNCADSGESRLESVGAGQPGRTQIIPMRGRLGQVLGVEKRGTVLDFCRGRQCILTSYWTEGVRKKGRSQR